MSEETRSDIPSAEPTDCGRDESGTGGAAQPGRLALDRRAFLQALGGGAAAALALGTAALPAAAAGSGPSPALSTADAVRRRNESYQVRVAAATLAKKRAPLRQLNNGEERDYPYLASYSKGLPHDALGHVDVNVYRAYLRILDSGAPQDFERIALGLGRKLTSPQAGLAYDLEGPDCGAVAMPPAPRIDGPENSSEMAELYWMALARDVHFSDYGADSTTQNAAGDLSTFSLFRGPKQGGSVTPATLFRGFTPGDLEGPYISQFLFKDIPYGVQTISQRNQTLLPGVDYATDFGVWLALQNGATQFGGTDLIDPSRRYLRNLRDLARYVQIDALYQAYLNACLMLLGMGCPLNSGNPLLGSATQAGFAEWGGPHILTLVTEVATRALKAVWHSKWFVHRRIRPEAMGGLVHNHVTGAAVYPIDPEILNSPVLDEVYSQFGSYLLPQAYPDASPTHPSYGSGHATVAGACITILKAWFDESFVIPNPVVANADGTALEPWSGPPLSVRGELDKVAANIGTGRNGAGIHWRTDFVEGVRLGERVAIGILQEQMLCHSKPARFSFTTVDGVRVTI